ncbi:N-acetylmuramoyl-L-alanine amidase [Streptomyces pseudogriseolus]|uniref:N-acetylmuramoyl-L-alanine amidase n=1 Tax=Streptomyces pseudogriseolus TaxID=36817 RepID=UPI003FA2A2CB
MATPLSASTLLAALKAEGCKVVEYKSWRTHNRNSKGAWGPVNGVMIHHTVSSGEESSVALCYNGHANLPGPLCHTVGGKSGKLYMVGHGRANHAGSGDGDVLRAVINETALPADNEANTDGNSRFYGLEIVNLGNGKDTYPAAQYDAAVRWAAALCRAHGWGARSVIGHKEWQPGKIDPLGPVEGRGSFDMDRFRADVGERLMHPASWSPGSSTPAPAKPQTPTPPKEDDVATPYENWSYKGKGETRDAYAYLRGTNAIVTSLTAQVAALSATVGKLAEGGGLDAAEIQAAAEAGARVALEKLGETLTDQA